MAHSKLSENNNSCKKPRLTLALGGSKKPQGGPNYPKVSLFFLFKVSEISVLESSFLCFFFLKVSSTTEPLCLQPVPCNRTNHWDEKATHHIQRKAQQQQLRPGTAIKEMNESCVFFFLKSCKHQNSSPLKASVCILWTSIQYFYMIFFFNFVVQGPSGEMYWMSLNKYTHLC